MFSLFSVKKNDIYCSAIRKIYPDGTSSLLVADRACFRVPGWEARDNEKAARDDLGPAGPNRAAENQERARRRARAAVAEIVRANPDMEYFVTLTLDKSKVDRYDYSEQQKVMRAWLSNRVQRCGLKYVVVPEFHGDGAIHYHGVFNDVLALKDSGTLSVAGGAPRRPRGAAERRKMLEDGAQVVYNLPEWKLGFSTVIQFYGERGRAVSYVCKYIGKNSEKIGGRYYLSGGPLQRADREYINANFDDFADDCRSFEIARLGAKCIKMDFDESGVLK